MRILALDIATVTGAAVDHPNGEGRPLCSTFRAPGHLDREDYGGRFAPFRVWLADMITVHDPELVAFEAPLMPRGNNMKTSVYIVRLLIGLASIAEEVATAMHKRTREENVQVIKAHFAGTGRADKEAMMARCRQLNWPVQNDHEADAAALWSYCKAKTDPRFQYSTTPLFAEGRA